MQIRFYFNMFPSRQLIGGINTAYTQEIKKLRRFALSEILPKIKQYSILKRPPYKVSFLFYTTSDIDNISLMTITTYILHCLEEELLQSTDYRVIKQIEVKSRKIIVKEKEGCEMTITRA